MNNKQYTVIIDIVNEENCILLLHMCMGGWDLSESVTVDLLVWCDSQLTSLAAH